MNRKIVVDQATLDRLADGELNVEEQRQLLERLEQNPGQWKQCALTFIELQSIETQMAHLFDGDDMVAGSMRQTVPNARRQPSSITWLLATAACVLVAFTAGQRYSPPDAFEGIAGPSVDGFAHSDRLAPAGQSLVAGDWWIGNSAVTPEMERNMETLGLRVQRSRGLYRQQAPDGRPVFYPYEDVKLIPARNVIQ